MRYEGKNGFLKTKRYKNFKNLPLSVSMHHQKHMSLKMTGHDGLPSENFLYSGDTVDEGVSIELDQAYPTLIGHLQGNDNAD